MTLTHKRRRTNRARTIFFQLCTLNKMHDNKDIDISNALLHVSNYINKMEVSIKNHSRVNK